MTSIQFAAKWPRLARLSPAPGHAGSAGSRTRTLHDFPEVIRINKRLRDDRLLQTGLSPRKTTVSRSAVCVLNEKVTRSTGARYWRRGFTAAKLHSTGICR
jgi:hypothetical protein